MTLVKRLISLAFSLFFYSKIVVIIYSILAIAMKNLTLRLNNKMLAIKKSII